MKLLATATILFFLPLFPIGAFSGSTMDSIPLELYGVKIKVTDIDAAKKFYVEKLKFPIEKEGADAKTVWLKTNGFKIVLAETRDAVKIDKPGYSHLSLSMRVNDIDATRKYLIENNIRLIKNEKRQEGVGYSLQILDPFGNKISLMQITVGKPETIVEPSVYNCGLYVTDIDLALKTYRDKLGFVVRSRDYMPEDMPLGYPDGRFAFMLHLRRADFAHVENPNMSLMFVSKRADVWNDFVHKGVSIKKTKTPGTYYLTDSVKIVSEVIVGN